MRSISVYISVGYLLTGLILIFKGDYLLTLLGFSETLSSFGSVIIGGGLIGSVLVLYVRGFFSNEGIAKKTLEDFEERIDSIIKDRTDEELSEKVDYRIKQLVDAKFIAQIDESASVYNKKIHTDLQQEFYLIRDRLTKEAATVARYAYTNLLIGFATTLGAIYVLYTTLGENPQQSTSNDYFFHILPRISLSILIELFAFFFLKMYKNNFADMKYYNNEKTNIDSKILALKTSLHHDDNPVIDKILENLATTERNFILKKDETTVDLQKTLIETNNSSKLIDTISSMIKQK